MIINYVKEDFGSLLIRGSYLEIIDLAFEDYAVAIDCSRVKGWFMNDRGKVKILEDDAGMFLPKDKEIQGGLA